MLSAIRSSVTKSAVLKRTFATSSGKTQYTSLQNGVTIATESNPAATSASIGLYYGAGSTAENAWNNGVSNLLNKAVVGENTAEAAKKGLVFSANTEREYSSYLVQGSSSSLSDAVEFLNSKVASFELNDATVSKYRESLAQEVATFEETQFGEKALEHLHNTAFQNTPLALPKRGTSETISDLITSDLAKFHKDNYVSSNAVVVATGNVDHAAIVDLVEKKLSIPSGIAPKVAAPKFLGSEVRLRDDTLPGAWIALAQKGAAVNSPDFYVAKVAAEIFGSYNYHEPIAKNLGVKLNGVVNENHLADTYSHFSLSYKGAGLFGAQFFITNIGQIDDFVHFLLKEWNRLSISITDTEIARGKQLLKNKLAFALDSQAAVNQSIGSQIVVSGRRASLEEAFAKIDKVDSAAIKAWAQANLWDQDIAVAGTGQIEDLLDYNRMRNDTSMMRW